MRYLRKSQGLSLDALHRRTGVPLARLRSVEAGDNPPFLSEAKAVAAALGTTIDALVSGVFTVRHLGAFFNMAASLPTNSDKTIGGE